VRPLGVERGFEPDRTVTGWVMSKSTDPVPSRSEINEAVMSTIRGGLRVLDGVVETVAGAARLVIDAAIRFVEPAQEAGPQTKVDDEDPNQKPEAQ
jgi:hypothetical protein